MRTDSIIAKDKRGKQSNISPSINNLGNRKLLYTRTYVPLWEEFEDTKGAIKIRRSKKNRQHIGQKKKYNGQQNINIKLKIE